MKTLNLISHQNTLQVARELFHRTWKIVTRTIVRSGPESVTWAIYADLEGHGGIPVALVAGGVCNNEPEAHEAMRQHFELWTVTGPTAMLVLGRAGW
jgi:D-aminopeptidase